MATVVRVRPLKERMSLFGKFFAGVWWAFFQKGILKIFSSFMSVMVIWGFNSLVKAYPGRAKEIIKTLVDAYLGKSGTALTFVSEYLKQMTGKELPVADLMGKPIGGWTDGATKAFIEAFFTDLLILVMPSREAIKADPMAGAERFLSANLKFQMDSWWMHVMGDIFSMGMFKSLKDLPMAISWATGMGWLSWLVMGMPFKIGITNEMEKHFNAIYMPTLLSPSQLIDAKMKDLIDWDTFNTGMLELGYHPDLYTVMYQTALRELPRLRMREMYQRGLLDSDAVQGEFRKMGYPENWSVKLTQDITDDKYYTLVESIADKAISLYSSNVLSESDLDQYLTTAGWNERERQMAKIKGKLGMLSGTIITDAQIPSLYELRELTWVGAIDMLVTRGWSRPNAEWWMKLHVKKEQWFAPK